MESVSIWLSIPLIGDSLSSNSLLHWRTVVLGILMGLLPISNRSSIMMISQMHTVCLMARYWNYMVLSKAKKESTLKSKYLVQPIHLHQATISQTPSSLPICPVTTFLLQSPPPFPPLHLPHHLPHPFTIQCKTSSRSWTPNPKTPAYQTKPC